MNEPVKKDISFKDTLNLPTTSFPIRSNPKVEEAEILAHWNKNSLEKKTFSANEGNTKFVIHDGPPYANGHIHLGHAFNKILKDIIAKFKRMSGYHVPLKPGWDCHGLPIEAKVSKSTPGLTRTELIAACRLYASEWIATQKKEFIALGVLMNWGEPYLTMNFSYESAIIKAFSILVHNGYIQRKERTISWCIHCKTVLASAEIEYADKEDPSIFVLFPITKESSAQLFESYRQAYVLIWTTTPWTLPLNQAVMAKPGATYVALEIDQKIILVGESAVSRINSLKKTEAKIIARFSAQELIEKRVQVTNPLFDKAVPLVLDEGISEQDGTVFVHCAPGVGPEDYEIGIRYNLPIFSPITEAGLFTAQVGLQELVGKNREEANQYVLEKLASSDRLFARRTIKHSYPHCWRCHNPLIFRATKQWFCNLAHKNLQDNALSAITQILFFPPASRNRFAATIESRLEWCISRQRAWGVPIPALICISCDAEYTSAQFIENVSAHVAKHGIEWWETVPLSALGTLPSCRSCHANSWQKELDILDVWFDSGVSGYAVLANDPDLSYPADLYIEGKDQHRGWFQSSLLLSLSILERASMKAIITHGFTVDERGHKMSKSLGNVISPEEMVSRLSTDGLRLWVASIDYADDAVVSEKIFTTISEVHRKIRNTCRFLLANLYDFTSKDQLPLEQLTVLDQYALFELFETYYKIIFAYESYNLTGVFRGLVDYATTELSAFYLDIIKDRLYVEKANGSKRRSAQTVCFFILDTLTKLLAPIMSFTAEQIKEQYQSKESPSIHLQLLPTLQQFAQLLAQTYPELNDLVPKQNDHEPLKDQLSTMKLLLQGIQKREEWNFIKRVRSELLKAIELKRETGLIKHPLEASLTIAFVKDEMQENTRELFTFWEEKFGATMEMEKFFKELLVVSTCKIVTQKYAEMSETEIHGIYVSVSRASGRKCPRCWHWTNTEQENGLCDRCAEILG